MASEGGGSRPPTPPHTTPERERGAALLRRQLAGRSLSGPLGAASRASKQREIDGQRRRGRDACLTWDGGRRLVLVVSGGGCLDGRRPVGATQARVQDIGFRTPGFVSNPNLPN